MKKLVLIIVLFPAALFAQPMNKQQVIEQVKSQYQGRVLSAERQASQPPSFKVKLLQPDGRVKVLRINADSSNKKRRAD